MSYTPFSMKDNVPCGKCGTRSYIQPVLGDCAITAGKTFCSDWCRRTFRQFNKAFGRFTFNHGGPHETRT